MAEGDRRTFSSYKTIVLHSLGNPDTSDLAISAGDIVNDALEHIANMHPWQWCSTGEQSLDIVEDQDYIELPADFGTPIAIEHDQNWTDQMVPVTWATLLWLRQHPIISWTSGFFYVINTGNVELGQEDAGLSLPTIALYPTPSATRADGVKIVYRRFLRRLVADTDRPQWPAYMDRMLTLLSRSMASVDYDDDPTNAYTPQFKEMLPDLMYQDGLSVQSFGVGAGAVQARRRATPFGYPDSGIPDPSVATP